MERRTRESMERTFLPKRGEKEEEEKEAAAEEEEETAGMAEQEREERVAAKAASMRPISSSLTISTGISATLIAEWAPESAMSARVCGPF